MLRGWKAGFESKYGFPNCMGAIDCTHVDINLTPHANSSDYYNKKCKYSIVVQAVVDSNLRFLDVNIGSPGSVHDARIYRTSALGEAISDRKLLTGSPVKLGSDSDIQVPEYLVGDAGYTMSPNMVIPYPGSNLSVLKDKFNFLHSSTRMAVERSFGRVKSIWRVLHKSIVCRSEDFIPVIVHCCFILANMALEEDGLEDIESVEDINSFNQEEAPTQERELQDQGFRIRDVIAKYVHELHEDGRCATCNGH